HDTTIRLTLTHARTGEQLTVPTDPDSRPHPLGGDHWANYGPAAFTARLPVAQVASRADIRDGDRWTLQVTVQTAGLTRSTQVNRIRPAGSVRHLGSHRTPSGFLCAPDLAAPVPFELQFIAADIELESAGLSGRTLTGSLTGSGAARARRVVLA